MKARHGPLEPARLAYDAQGVPAATLYDDVYHARVGAMVQARHVFIQGNDLLDRWRDRDSFTVCETGFGLGNNFLALWQAWREAPQRPQRLHVLSFEAHPFRAGDLAAALATHEGELRELAEQLVRAWPPLVPGLHRIEFENGRVTLTLAFGRVEHMARQVDAHVDAFFLDGFSPRVNPEMWSKSLFGQLVRIANRGATAATWCSAGQVRRDLSAAGFLVAREPGLGGKRHMIRAQLRSNLGRPLPSPVPMQDSVIVLGGGFAGAGVAHSLALRGHPVTVFDPAFSAGRAASHVGHRSAAMTPAFSRDDNPMCRLSRAGVLLAQLRWRHLAGVVERCGSLLRVPPEENDLWQRALEALCLPEDWARWCPASDTRATTGLSLSRGGVWLAAGSRLRPDRLVSALLSHDNVDSRQEQVVALRDHGGMWQALSSSGEVLSEARRVVLAAGPATPSLLSASFPSVNLQKMNAMQRLGGQVAYFRAGQVPDTRAIIAGAGYWLPQVEGVHTGGSTYVYEGELSHPTYQGFQAVAEKVAELLETEPERLSAAAAEPSGWAGWRASLSDHLPVIGPLDETDSLWMVAGYGSRGLSWMTLAGEVMATRLNAEPQIVERELLKSVRPR